MAGKVYYQFLLEKMTKAGYNVVYNELFSAVTTNA